MVDPACSLLDELKPFAWWTLFWRNRIWVRGQIWPSNNRAWAGLYCWEGLPCGNETNRGHWLGQVIYSGCAQEKPVFPAILWGIPPDG